ncbi:KPN_02809 family neutral zinc metallopeptidase [Aestuariimicrobium ganziense]|uniref:KPN_02809 family neutral zinc metallopeptidase n=1 Tax=Aestuariimicrobium ganziense TaxID=2773677 RepID=UPI001942A0A4|nr:neutral zinc metallopeptidase [Aestuariimicrobium ganziense]
MDFKDDARLDTGSVISSGGGGGGRGGGIAVGGIGGLILMLIAVFLGINPGDIMGGGGAGQPADTSQQTPANSECKTGADVDRNPDCRWQAYMTSLNQYWESTVSQGYQPTKMVTFSGAVNTACGQASSQVGPFYCPGDSTIYIDKAFAGQLLKQLGAKGGPAAEAYIVAHEYGHHIQNLTGVLQRSQQDRNPGPGSPGVRVELQADCYAGAWFRWASDNPNDVIENITKDDLDRIVDAAKVVGDDHIQEQQGGYVNPEQWTHGSSAQRKYWVAKGFNSGDPNVCDTFATNDLGPQS